MRGLSKGKLILIAGVLAAVSFVLKFFIGYHWLTVSLMIIGTAVAGLPIFKKAVSGLRYFVIGVDVLVSIAVIGAMFIGEFWEAAAVSFLFMFGEYLESKTIEKTRSSIKALLDLTPAAARVKKDGTEMEISPQDVVKGDLVIVKPGEKIAVDGIVTEGNAYVNQAAITGEPIPLNRGENDTVYSGTVVESGYLVVKAEKVGDDTTFARILHLVEEAQDKKTKTQKFLERFARYYTPAVIVLSALVYIVTRDIVLALTLLTISCPGALVVSVPGSLVAGIGNGAGHGVLIKGGETMERLGAVKVVAFDKTGTLTLGKPGVTAVKGYGITEEELIKIAAAGESYSEHPLGRAIIEKAKTQYGGTFRFPENAEIITGKGLKFSLDKKVYYIGNRSLIHQNDISTAEFENYISGEEEKGQTAVIISDEKQIIGIISIADTVRDDAAKLVKDLKAQGIKKVVMLTGDNERAAKHIAEKAGLDEYYSELLPEDKVRILEDLQQRHGKAAMVGDGVNDAPAIAAADFGIAVGGAGSDVAMETADVVLMSDKVGKLSYAVGLSRATVRNMKQNIAFALLVAALLLTGVLFKTVNLSLGMLFHELSVVLVVVNALRLLRYGKKGRNRRIKEGAL